jgi:hypothetical protein
MAHNTQIALPHGPHHNHHASPNEKLISTCLTKNKIGLITTPNAKLNIQMPHQMKYKFFPCLTK